MPNKISSADSANMRLLKLFNVPIGRIAKQYGVTTPTVKYHTDMVEPQSLKVTIHQLRKLKQPRETAEALASAQPRTYYKGFNSPKYCMHQQPMETI